MLSQSPSVEPTLLQTPLSQVKSVLYSEVSSLEELCMQMCYLGADKSVDCPQFTGVYIYKSRNYKILSSNGTMAI